MGRKRRFDADGEVFHVFNRGAARRTIYEWRRDWRYFESRLAHAVRRREIVILAFCLLMNHFHLLIRSRGKMSEAMRRIQREHAVYFNRSRGRGGPLLTGRFHAIPVESDAALLNSFCYVDENAVEAGLARRPEEWTWGSAYLFASGRPPRWLSTELVDDLGIRYGAGGTPLAPRETRVARAAWMDARMAGPSTGDDPLDAVLSGVPDVVWEWMLAAAALADETRPGMPVAGIRTVAAAIAGLPADVAQTRLALPRTNRQPFGRVLLAGLLRDAAAATFAEIAPFVDASPSAARRLHGLHLRGLREDEAYGRLAREIVEACVAPLRP